MNIPQIGSKAELAKMPTPALLGLYNKLTGKDTSKFASRAKGEEQVWKAYEAHKAKNPAPAPKAKPAAAAQTNAEGKKMPKNRTYESDVKKNIVIPRPSSKRYQMLLLMKRPEGASIEEIADACDWAKNDAADAIALLNKQNNYPFERIDGRYFVDQDADKNAGPKTEDVE